MSRELDPSGKAAARAVWSLAALVICAGWYISNTRYEKAIAITNSASETLYRKAVRNEALLTRASRLRTVRQSVLRELSRYAPMSLKPDSTVALVDTLAKCALPLRVQITALQPVDQAASKSTSHEDGVKALNALAGVAQRLTVRGRFTDIVRFVQRLSRQRMPIEVQRVQISRVDQIAGAPLVEGTIDVMAFRLMPAEVADATAN